MKQYSKYKNSGIDWLGNIPEHWEVKRVKDVAMLQSGDNLSADNIFEDGLYPVFGGGEKIGFTDKWNANDNCILIGRVGARCGCVTYPNTKSWATDNALVLTTTVKLPYMYYLLDSMNLNDLNVSNAQPLITGSRIKTIFIPFPPYPEQTAIAAYLDEKTANIDRRIELLRNKIDNYKQLRRSLISQVVTRGLNPDVKLKNSGIEWLGDVPEGWKVMHTVNALSMPITDGPHTTPDFYDEGIPFVSAEAVSCGNGRIDFNHIRGYISKEFYDECCLKYIPKVNDIYMIKSGATTGKVAIVDTDRIFTIWSPLAVFRCNTRILIPNYMFYYLQSDYYQFQVSLNWSFGTQQNIGMRSLEKIDIALPPLIEQTAIAAYLDDKTAQIDSIIGKCEKQIEQLSALRRSLIAEAVTGKIKVC